MASRKSIENLLELCNRVTGVGNSIAVRLLEHLSTNKQLPLGFKELTFDFLDLSRFIWSIEAGLLEVSQINSRVVADGFLELEQRLRKTHTDLSALNQALLKYLGYENKGTFGRLQKGFRSMFSNVDLDKMRETLMYNRNALRMSALTMKWTTGDLPMVTSMGLGFSSLVSAVERLNPPEMPAAMPAATSRLSPAHSPALSPVPLSPTSNHANGIPPRFDSFMAAHEQEERQSELYRRYSVASSGHRTQNMQAKHESSVPSHQATGSDESTLSNALGSTHLKSESKAFEYPTQFVRIKADPTRMAHWTPRVTSGSISSSSSKSALLTAIKSGDHRAMESLLDGGASPRDPNLLAQACEAKDEEALQLLLAFGGDANAADRNGMTPLYHATEVAFCAGAQLLIKYGADPNRCAGPESISPLALSIQEANFELLHLYLMYGGDAAQVMENGNTPLTGAINKTVPIKIIEFLLDYGTDADAKDREGTTAMFAAIQASRLDIVSLLLDHKANPNLPGPKHPLWPSTYKPDILRLLLARGGDTKKTPGIMELAASLKNLESISVLLEAGISPNTKKDGIYTPLCSAIRDNSVEIVNLLLANGADPNLPAAEYPAFKCVTHNRLHLLPQLVLAGADLHKPSGIIETAVTHNSMEAVKYFLQSGVSPNDRSADGHTPLTTAIRENKPEMIDYLLAHGADPNKRGENWPIAMAVSRPDVLKKLLAAVDNPSSVRGAIEMAVMANQLESIKLLLKAGVSVEDKTGGVFSPLTTALREDRKDLVRFLLYEAAADPNAPGEHLPLVKAIRRFNGSDTDCIEMLLKCGADVNKMYRDWSPVLQAVETGDTKVLNLMIKKGNPVDLSIKDESGRTVRELVTERGWDEGCTLLFPKPPGGFSYQK